MPDSVTNAVTRWPGVTSNAGLYTTAPSGAARVPANAATSSAARSSIGIASPLCQAEVERRARRRDVKRNAVMRGEDRKRVGPDLVRGVAVARDAVGADDREIDALPLHRNRGGRVDDQHGVDAGLPKLEVVQPRALQQRARLIHENPRLLPARDAPR